MWSVRIFRTSESVEPGLSDSKMFDAWWSSKMRFCFNRIYRYLKEIKVGGLWKGMLKGILLKCFCRKRISDLNFFVMIFFFFGDNNFIHFTSVHYIYFKYLIYSIDFNLPWLSECGSRRRFPFRLTFVYSGSLLCVNYNLF